MVGLSVLLELAQDRNTSNKRSPQVISKISSKGIINKPLKPSPTSSNFLHFCFLCNQRLMPGRDIYMYKGDRAFCSVECRGRQMVMDDEEINARRDNNSSCYYFSNSMTNNTPTSSSSRHHSQNSSSTESKNRGGAGHGLFAY